MRVKFFAGKWDSVGFEVSYCHYIKAVTIGFVAWYFGFEVWTKEEVERQKQYDREIKDLIQQMIKEEEEEAAKEAKKATKKKAVKKK